MLNINSPVVQNMIAQTPQGYGNFNIQNGYYMGPPPSVQTQWVPVNQAPSFNQPMANYEQSQPQMFNQPQQFYPNPMYPSNPYYPQQPMMPIPQQQYGQPMPMQPMPQYGQPMPMQPMQAMPQQMTQYGVMPMTGYAQFNNVNPMQQSSIITDNSSTKEPTMEELSKMNPSDRINALFKNYDNPYMPKITPHIDGPVQPSSPLAFNPYYGTGAFWHQPQPQYGQPMLPQGGFINPFSGNNFSQYIYGVKIPSKYNFNSAYVQQEAYQASLNGLEFEDQLANDTIMEQKIISIKCAYVGADKDTTKERLDKYQKDMEKYLYWPKFGNDDGTPVPAKKDNKSRLRIAIYRGDELVVDCSNVRQVYTDEQRLQLVEQDIAMERRFIEREINYRVACGELHYRNQNLIPNNIDLYDYLNGGYAGFVAADQRRFKEKNAKNMNIMKAFEQYRWRKELEKNSKIFKYSSVGLGPFGKSLDAPIKNRKEDELDIPVPNGPVFRDFTKFIPEYNAEHAEEEHGRIKEYEDRSNIPSVNDFENQAGASYTLPEYRPGMSREEYIKLALDTCLTSEDKRDLNYNDGRISITPPDFIKDHYAKEVDMKRMQFQSRMNHNMEHHKHVGGTE